MLVSVVLGVVVDVLSDVEVLLPPVVVGVFICKPGVVDACGDRVKARPVLKEGGGGGA